VLAHMVVAAYAPLVHPPDLVKGLEDQSVEHFSAIGAIEQFDQAVLHRPPWLNVSELDALGNGPLSP
jgi:hypothetical protein